jgi:hypothetical protein
MAGHSKGGQGLNQAVVPQKMKKKIQEQINVLKQNKYVEELKPKIIRHLVRLVRVSTNTVLKKEK